VSRSHLLNRITEELKPIHVLRGALAKQDPSQPRRPCFPTIFPLSQWQYSHNIEDGVQRSLCGRGLVSLGVDGGQDRRAAVGASDVARHSNLFFSRHGGGADAIRTKIESCRRVRLKKVKAAVARTEVLSLDLGETRSDNEWTD
jgi:hypothetical protein